MKLTPAEKRWVNALLHRQRGRLRQAHEACEAARRLSPATAPQLSFQADVEASLGLAIRAARTTLQAAEADPGLRLIAARRLWQASFFGAAEAQALAATRSTEARRIASLCRAFRMVRPALAEPRIVVEPRLELAAVVGALAAGPGLRTGFTLRGPALTWFKPFRSHRAVRLYRQAAQEGLTAVGIQRSMVSLPFGTPRRAALFEALQDFAARARLQRYFASQRRFYDETVARVVAEARRRRYAALFARYTGLVPPALYTVALSPFHSPDRSARLNHLGSPGPDGRYHIFTTLPPPFDYAPLAWSIWHELSHSLTDHWLENQERSLDRSRKALAPVSARRYGSWEQALREHVVQGLAYRMVSWSGAPERPDAGEGDSCLPYLPQVVRALGDYEKRRGRYRTLADFYPTLLKLFERIAVRAHGGAREGNAPRAQADGLI